mmetsp:Transcript_146873/g.271217  ORF Transcript_146873/g.271217 Transcript_146873/m.271217 type:complete len:409 (-) Transcript_146873:56-1282(-)
MPTEFGHDFDWEHAGTHAETPSVSCVSLGCWCGIASCLNALELRDAAYPFDWNRTTMQGVIHFLQTGFVDFLNFSAVKDYEGSRSSGGKTFMGRHHSVWHEDCRTAEGTGKYQRRFSRFLQNSAQRILFIRALNTHTEVLEGEQLLKVLKCLFPHSEVYLLLIADCQPAEKMFFVDGTDDHLLVSCIDECELGTPDYGGTCPVYHDAVRFAYRYANSDFEKGDNVPFRISGLQSFLERLFLQEHEDEVFSETSRAGSCVELFSQLAPFFCGNPQEQPYTPCPGAAPTTCLGSQPALATLQPAHPKLLSTPSHMQVGAVQRIPLVQAGQWNQAGQQVQTSPRAQQVQASPRAPGSAAQVYSSLGACGRSWPTRAVSVQPANKIPIMASSDFHSNANVGLQTLVQLPHGS